MRYPIALLLAAIAVQAHYNFPKLIYGGATEPTDWGHVRKAKNFQSNGFVGDVTSIDIRCNQLGDKAQTASVTAGSTIGFAANQAVYHPGPLQAYMAKVPEGQSIDSWDGSGKVWFKVYTTPAPTVSGSQLKWFSDNKSSFTFPLPKSLPNGDYLVRIEHLALHSAAASGPQFYISCGQVKVSGGGSGTPGPLVAFPGAYQSNDPAIRVNINYPVPTNYIAPGPAVWSG